MLPRQITGDIAGTHFVMTCHAAPLAWRCRHAATALYQHALDLANIDRTPLGLRLRDAKIYQARRADAGQLALLAAHTHGHRRAAALLYYGPFRRRPMLMLKSAGRHFQARPFPACALAGATTLRPARSVPRESSGRQPERVRCIMIDAARVRDFRRRMPHCCAGFIAAPQHAESASDMATRLLSRRAARPATARRPPAPQRAGPRPRSKAFPGC